MWTQASSIVIISHSEQTIVTDTAHEGTDGSATQQELITMASLASARLQWFTGWDYESFLDILHLFRNLNWKL